MPIAGTMQAPLSDFRFFARHLAAAPNTNGTAGPDIMAPHRRPALGVDLVGNQGSTEAAGRAARRAAAAELDPEDTGYSTAPRLEDTSVIAYCRRSRCFLADPRWVPASRRRGRSWPSCRRAIPAVPAAGRGPQWLGSPQSAAMGAAPCAPALARCRARVPPAFSARARRAAP